MAAPCSQCGQPLKPRQKRFCSVGCKVAYGSSNRNARKVLKLGEKAAWDQFLGIRR